MKGTIVAIMLFFGLNGCQEVSSPPPNILWITVEDISTNLGCYGDSLAYTPT
ncbi:MAG: hypothetical protein GWP29_01280, partial [Bacteroidetes bacterium]|nr:hypothetical protein [Bacteroidota bacterium]